MQRKVLQAPMAATSFSVRTMATAAAADPSHPAERFQAGHERGIGTATRRVAGMDLGRSAARCPRRGGLNRRLWRTRQAYTGLSSARSSAVSATSVWASSTDSPTRSVSLLANFWRRDRGLRGRLKRRNDREQARRAPRYHRLERLKTPESGDLQLGGCFGLP